MRTPEGSTRTRVPVPRVETITLPEAAPERPSVDRLSWFAAAVAIVAAVAAAGFLGARIGADELEAVEGRLDHQVQIVDALQGSTLFDAGGLYTGVREAGGVVVTPIADATGLFTAYREAAGPLVDPTGLYTSAREGSG